jgi:hypothetical protein
LIYVPPVLAGIDGRVDANRDHQLSDVKVEEPLSMAASTFDTPPCRKQRVKVAGWSAQMYR